jgi:YidC/Oxa1 family membrane protein insertase
MEKRVLIAVFLSFLVIYVYQALMPAPPPPARPAAGQGVAPTPSQGTPAQTPGTSVSSEGATAAPPVTPLVADTEARDITVETDDVLAVFSTRGAVLKQWRLKRYDTDGRPLELVPLDLPAGTALPFQLSLDAAGVASALNAALFRPSPPGAAEGGGRAITFEYEDESGLQAKKTFVVGREGHPHLLGFSVSVQSSGRALNPTLTLGPALGTGTRPSSTFALPRAIFSRDREVTRVGAEDLGDPTIEEGTFDFVGADDHYFMSAVLLPRKPMHVEYRALTIPGATEAETRNYVQYTARFAAAPEDERLFLGPKDFDVLARIDHNLTRAIDFGMFAWLVVPLLRALKWVNSGVGNYGWSIIILTVLINLAMFPLRHKSVVSMRKLQEIQPQVKAIQDRYAKLKMTDPARQKMNVEMMNLYRERGVNPASGCVPMLLTFPVLLAFYALLSVAVEIRGEPWIWWIRDLAAHDPLYVTPVLMGATMVWQQRLTPMNVDPMQQKILMLTPIMFTFFFLWAPSGLVLYWLVSNVWAIGQQLITNRIIGPPPQHTVRPAAERRIKKVGSGKTNQAR